MSNRVAPKVDHQYWFDWSKLRIDSALSRRDDAAKTIQTFVKWIWPLYTGATALGFTLSQKELSLGGTILIATASASLVLVYWAADWVRTPSRGKFRRLDSPDYIKDEYKRVVATKQRRLIFTSTISLVAAILVTLGLIISSVPQASQPVAPKFDATVHTAGSELILAVSGELPNAKEVTVIIEPQNEDSLSIIHRLLLLQEGILQTSLSMKEKANEYKVSLEWVTPEDITIRTVKNIQHVSES